jgi:hypothetical protein
MGRGITWTKEKAIDLKEFLKIKTIYGASFARDLNSNRSGALKSED